MGRLIDADELKKDIDDFEKEFDSNFLMKGLTVKEVLNAFRNSVIRAQTACDLDKVVEELEKEAVYTDNLDIDVQFVELKEAIDIVKKGGVE